MKIFFLFCLLSIYQVTFSLPNNFNNDKNINPVLLISLDGFRASKLNEFLDQYPESTLKTQFVNVGVKADSVYKYMLS